jgi:hypothetical protein
MNRKEASWTWAIDDKTIMPSDEPFAIPVVRNIFRLVLWASGKIFFVVDIGDGGGNNAGSAHVWQFGHVVSSRAFLGSRLTEAKSADGTKSINSIARGPGFWGAAK